MGGLEKFPKPHYSEIRTDRNRTMRGLPVGRYAIQEETVVIWLFFSVLAVFLILKN